MENGKHQSQLLILGGAIAIAILAVVSSLLYVYTGSRKDKDMMLEQTKDDATDNTATDQTGVTSTADTISFVDTQTIDLTSANTVWNSGTSQVVTISVNPNNDIKPNVATLVVTYDPAVLRYASAKPGELWDSTNVLDETVDETVGRITYSLGQNFGSQVTDNLSIATFTFEVINATSGNTEISLADESLLAVVGYSKQVKLNSLPLLVTLEE